MEYSKLGLEHFTPDYTRYFHGLPEPVRTRLVDAQWQLYKGISAETMAEIHDELYRRSVHCGWPDVAITPGVEVRAARQVDGRYELDLGHTQDQAPAPSRRTGSCWRPGTPNVHWSELLGPLHERLVRDAAGRLLVDADYRVRFDPAIGGALFVQNAEMHTHGVGSPDLGLGAWRAATILNSILRREVFRLPKRTAFTRFGLAPSTERLIVTKESWQRAGTPDHAQDARRTQLRGPAEAHRFSRRAVVAGAAGEVGTGSPRGAARSSAGWSHRPARPARSATGRRNRRPIRARCSWTRAPCSG